MKRIVGFDVARALAIFGMVIVNYRVVLSSGDDPAWLSWLTGLFAGRAAALFLVLAGIGIALLAKRHAAEPADRNQARQMLLRRALFLFVVGLSYTPLWPGDILKWYGIFIAISVVLLFARNWVFITSILTCLLVSSWWLLTFDYSAGWDWKTLEYTDFWTLNGMGRHLFFNGPHPVFPWLCFMLLGILIGRLDLANPAVRRIVFWVSVSIALITEFGSRFLIWAVGLLGESREIADLQSLFLTQPMPPTLLYVVAAAATALAVTMMCIAAAERFPAAWGTRILANTGKLALTIYVSHVVLVLLPLSIAGLGNSFTLSISMLIALIFVVMSVVFANQVLKRYRAGPLERVMRWITRT